MLNDTHASLQGTILILHIMGWHLMAIFVLPFFWGGGLSSSFFLFDFFIRVCVKKINPVVNIQCFAYCTRNLILVLME